MESDTTPHQALMDRLTRSLSQPAARIGSRLRSERELAAALGVGRRRVAWAIGKLAQQGVVARRVGDGTYLRRMPTAIKDESGTTGAHAGIIPHEQLFTGESAPAPRAGHNLRLPTQLRLGICWLSLSEMSRANRVTLDGMLTRAQELGHALSYHSFDMPGPEGVEQAVQLFSRHRFDGLLVCANDHVVNRIDEVARFLGRRSPPRAFFYSSDASPKFHPSVTLHSSGAAQHAVELLVAEGHKKIGLMTLDAPHADRAYDAAMRDAGLAFRAVSLARFAGKVSIAEMDVIKEGRRCAMEMLKAKQRPDAIYVADDVLMLGVAEALAEQDIVPGRDLGVISLANLGGAVPPTYAWSRLTMDPARLGRLAVDALIDVVDPDPARLRSNLRLDPAWCPGETHLRRR